MNRTSAFFIFALIMAGLSSAEAQGVRTFVSGTGTDTGNCGRTAPCRTFSYVIGQTASAGEIVVLDSAGYGAVTISKSITINNPGGVEAGIAAATGTDAVTINATSHITVTLRGLTLEGSDAGSNGIHLTSTASGELNIIDCVVKDFTNNGIFIDYGPSNTSTLQLLIANSKTLNNTSHGIYLDIRTPGTSTGTSLNYSIDGTFATGNGIGIEVNNSGFVHGTIQDLAADFNLQKGLLFSGGGFAWGAVLRHSHIFNNQSGVDVDDEDTTPGGIGLFDHNTIAQLINAGNNVETDLTNNVLTLTGSALTNVGQQ